MGCHLDLGLGFRLQATTTDLRIDELDVSPEDRAMGTQASVLYLVGDAK